MIEPTGEPPIIKQSEIVGGLSLSFEDAIKFHEQNGNHQLAKQLRQAGLAEIRQVNNAALIGETHIRTIVDRQNEEQFQQAIRSSDIIVLEHDTIANNPFSVSSPEKRFMQEAQEHALATGKQLHILDTELGTELKDKYALAEKSGLDLSRDEYAYMVSVNTLINGFMSGVSIDNIDAALRARLSAFIADERQVSTVADEAVSQFIQSLQDLSKLRDYQSVVASFASIDSTVRERGYQQRIFEIIVANPDKNVAAIVGKAHLQPIEQSMTETYLTPPDAASIDTMRKARNNLRQTRLLPK